MRATLRRLPLEAAVLLGIVLTVVDVAAGSNWSPDVRAVAGPLRWLLLGALCLASLAYALSGLERRLLRQAPYGWALALLVVACLSGLWTVEPRVTAGRWISFGTVVVTAGSLALAVAARREAAQRILLAVLAGAVGVALIGVGLLAANPDSAIQGATQTTAARFRGLGQNPNTVVMLFAAAMPVAVWAATVFGGLRRAAALGAFALLAGSIVASGSRAALLAGFVAAAGPVLAASTGVRAKGLALLACVAALGAGLVMMRLPDPNPSSRERTAVSAEPCTPRDAECFLRLQDEVGRPARDRFEPSRGRFLLGSSGRLEAWEGGVDQGAERLIAGYGFGTEGRVFVDRYYSFEGGVPENSFIGIFLQLGAVGFVLLTALLASLVLAALRALRLAAVDERVLVAACGAVLGVALVLALFQSYLYAAGNTATLSVWICAFLLTALPARRRQSS